MWAKPKGMDRMKEVKKVWLYRRIRGQDVELEEG